MLQRSYGPSELSVTILDTGRGAPSSLTGAGSGNGLIGMQERVDAYDGTLTAGPERGGGYRVHAVFPSARSPVG